jgi:hypothetical protein
MTEVLTPDDIYGNMELTDPDTGKTARHKVQDEFCQNIHSTKAEERRRDIWIHVSLFVWVRVRIRVNIHKQGNTNL